MDHKPLVLILSCKYLNLNDFPHRVLRFKPRMAKFDHNISHVPGKLVYTIDALSRDPIPEQEPSTLQKEVEVFVNSVTKMHQSKDSKRNVKHNSKTKCVCRCKIKKTHTPNLAPYWKAQDSLFAMIYCCTTHV